MSTVGPINLSDNGLLILIGALFILISMGIRGKIIKNPHRKVIVSEFITNPHPVFKVLLFIIGSSFIIIGTAPLLSNFPYIQKGESTSIETPSEVPISQHTETLEEAAKRLKSEGDLFYDEKNFLKAIQCYDKVLEIDPENIAALNSKGSAFYEMGEYEKAISCFDIILEIDPENGAACNSKGYAFKEMGEREQTNGKYEQAKDEYEQAIQAFDETLRLSSKEDFPDAQKGKDYCLEQLKLLA